MAAVYAIGSEIASYSGRHDQMLIIGTLADRREPADPFPGNHALDIPGLDPMRAPYRGEFCTKFLQNFMHIAAFNVTRIIQFCAQDHHI